MEIGLLHETIKRGEDSRRQFKKNVTNADSVAADMVAFSNGDGGVMLIGVCDDGSIAGLTSEDIHRLNQLISNAASQNVQPAINPTTENIMTDSGLVMVVDIPSGINKPYQDKNGVFWVKSGADRRKATSREEIQRMFQRAGLIHADAMPVPGLTVDDMDWGYFKRFYEKRFKKTLDDEPIAAQRILENMNLLGGGFLTVSGALLFAKNPQYKYPVSIVKAAVFDSTDVNTDNYSDSREFEGKLEDVYQQTLFFILNNLRHVQGGQGRNSIGIPEIPHEAIEEIVVNALVHRDYFIASNIRVFIFRDRVEIISPGHLPNNLTVENIKTGNSNQRNQVLASYASHILPYRGIGTGVAYALEKHPHIDFVDDREQNQFKVSMARVASSVVRHRKQCEG
jgi:ATP-dependent DNA helicase RecG